jgi:predicted nucleic acid-binding protein
MEDGVYSNQVEDLFNKVHTGKLEAIIAYEAITTLKERLLRAGKIKELNIFFEAISDFSNLHIYYLSIVEERYVLQVMFKYRLSYLQSLHFYIARKHNIKLITFSDAYKNIPEIKVVTP